MPLDVGAEQQQILCMVHASAAQAVERFDVAGERERVGIGNDRVARLPFREQVRATLFEHLLLGSQIALRLQQVRVRAGRQLDDGAQFRERRFLEGQFLQVRRQPPHAFELRAQRFETTLLGTRLVDLVFDRVARLLALDPVARAHLDRLQFADRIVV
ncbi:hypothetical protein AK36_6085 [Burkholderia vietnamiensis LMG 10929]|nr:hypothetical protein AK36_6085 [Burkholderia vietnamiensis LMG 10929]